MSNLNKETHDSEFQEGDKVTVTINKNGRWHGTVEGIFVRQTSASRATVKVHGKHKSYSVLNINAGHAARRLHRQ